MRPGRSSLGKAAQMLLTTRMTSLLLLIFLSTTSKSNKYQKRLTTSTLAALPYISLPLAPSAAVASHKSATLGPPPIHQTQHHPLFATLSSLQPPSLPLKNLLIIIIRLVHGLTAHERKLDSTSVHLIASASSPAAMSGLKQTFRRIAKQPKFETFLHREFSNPDQPPDLISSRSNKQRGINLKHEP